jgi:large subunit ribosomal protein L31
MRPDLHPLYSVTKVNCACGNVFETRSTKPEGELHLDICSACHPFYTGKVKLMDTQGRIELFNKKYGAKPAAAAAEAAPAAKAEEKAPAAEKAAKPAKEKKPKAPKAEA